MNGFIARTVAAVCLTGGMAALTGCYGYKDLVDPAYPERYNYTAYKETCEAKAPQIHNGHILDQTIWNWHFETGKGNLNEAGMDHLVYLIRRRPCPDSVIYLATAEDIPYNSATRDKFPALRSQLDQARKEAIEAYIAAQTAGRGLNFEVVVHDPAVPDMGAQQMSQQINRWIPNFQGILGTAGAAGGTGAAAGGASPPGGR